MYTMKNEATQRKHRQQVTIRQYLEPGTSHKPIVKQEEVLPRDKSHLNFFFVFWVTRIEFKERLIANCESQCRFGSENGVLGCWP